MSDGGIHVLVGTNAKYHTYIAKERGDDDTLDDNQLQDAPGLGTDGFTDTEFVGALLDGDEHDVRHAHDT